VSNQDHKFFDLFILIIVVLVGISIILFFLARFVVDQTEDLTTDTMYQEKLEERIKPVGRAALPWDEPEQASAAIASVAVATPVATTLSGPQVYNAACVSCHGTGIAGAPEVGDAAAWTDRIATGMDQLTKHAIDGFQGNTGYMPPKGGRTDLSDQEISSAVEYMVSESK